MKKKKGFTLLELLVVVLIIGILAGIALPQYQRAKEKAEAAELLTNVKALHEAQHRYFLVNGTFAENFDDLDISFGGYERNGCDVFSGFSKYDCISNSKNVIFISSAYNAIASCAFRKTGKYKYGGFMFQETSAQGLPINQLLCYRDKFCSKLLDCNFIKYISNTSNAYYSCKF